MITGASSGIGEALARLLAAEGTSLILVGRDRPRLEGLAEDLKGRVSVEWEVADLTTSAGRAQVVASIHRSAPDLVINNAGMGLYGEVLSYQTSEQQEMVDLNISALLQLTLEAGRTLVSLKQPGVILNVSSVAATPVMPYFSVYSATKAFVNQFSESLDFEWRAQGVRVLVACPGRVATRFQERAGTPREESERVMSAAFAAQEILKQVHCRQRLHTFDWSYRLITFFTRYVLPKSWVAAIIGRAMRARGTGRALIPIAKDENS